MTKVHPNHPVVPYRSKWCLWQTPRIRRIKYDEGRPSCRRCVKTGQKCDRYLPVQPTIRNESPPLTPPQTWIMHRPNFGAWHFREPTRTQLFRRLSTLYDSIALWLRRNPKASIATPSQSSWAGSSSCCYCSGVALPEVHNQWVFCFAIQTKSRSG